MSIELSEISDAFRTLIGRRRRLMTFLSTAFAAVGLLLVQVLRGEWPGARVGFSEHAVMLAAAGQGALGMICLVREARIHRLIAFYGVLFARTMVGAQRVSEDEQTASGRLNWLGISALMFYMALGYTDCGQARLSGGFR